MKTLTLVTALMVGMVMALPEIYAESLTVTTGGEKGTYHAFFTNIQAKCDEEVSITEVLSSGSDENIERMILKQADIGFVQTDALQFRAMGDPRAGEDYIKTLLVLYPEEVHVVVLRDFRVGAKKGTLGFGAKEGRAPESLADLAEQQIGAWGGSYTTAQVLKAQANLTSMGVVLFNDASEGKQALDEGVVTALIVVGGQPLGFVKDMNQQYRLLSVNEDIASRATFYVKTRLNYRNVLAQGVPTVAAQALLVTRNFKLASKKAEVLALRNCIVKNLPEFVDGTGYHPKWADVNPGADSIRAYYDAAPNKPAARKK